MSFTNKQKAFIFKVAFLEAMALSLVIPSSTSSGELPVNCTSITNGSCEKEKVITGQTTVTVSTGQTSGTSATITYSSAFATNPNYDFWWPAGTTLPPATIVTNYMLAQPTQVPCGGSGCNVTRFLSNFTQSIPTANQCFGCLTEWMNDSSNEFSFDSTNIGRLAIDYLFIPSVVGSCDCSIVLQAQLSFGVWTTCVTSGIDFGITVVQLVSGQIGNNGCLNFVGQYRIAILYDHTPINGAAWSSGRITLRAYTTAIDTPTPIPVCGGVFVPCKTKLQVKITVLLPFASSTTFTINFKAFVCLNGSNSC